MQGGPRSSTNGREVGAASTSTPAPARVAAVLASNRPGARPRCPPSWAWASDRCRLSRPHRPRPRSLRGGRHGCSRSRSTGLPLDIPTPPARIRNRCPLERRSVVLPRLPTTTPRASRWASSASTLKRFPGASPRATSRTSLRMARRLPRRPRLRPLLKGLERGEDRKRSHERFQERSVLFSSENGDCI